MKKLLVLIAMLGAFGLALVMLLAIISSPMRGGRIIFLDIGNLTDILRQVAEKGILAVGMTAVIIAGGIDLSVGSVMAISGGSLRRRARSGRRGPSRGAVGRTARRCSQTARSRRSRSRPRNQ